MQFKWKIKERERQRGRENKGGEWRRIRKGNGEGKRGEEGKGAKRKKRKGEDIKISAMQQGRMIENEMKAIIQGMLGVKKQRIAKHNSHRRY